MRGFGKRLVQGLLILLVVVAALALWKRENLARLWAAITVFNEGKIVDNFSSMNTAFLHTSIDHGSAEPLPFETGALTLPDGFEDWINERSVTSIIVLRDGILLHEAYYKGTGEDDLRISWSVAKSYLSVLMGIVLEEGAISSLDEPVTTYVPSLKGTAYDGATIRNVLQMESGVAFNEDYFDTFSDINRMGRVLALGQKMDDFTTALTATAGPPGEIWRYVSIDTHVLSMVIREATGQSIVDLLGQKVITPLRQERAPYYLVDGDGVAFVLGGLNVTTRDYARFGQMVLDGGVAHGTRIVNAEWLLESTAPSAKTEPGERYYGYQWWAPPDARPGEFYGHGIYGQFIYIDRETRTVIVRTAADYDFREPATRAQNMAMFRALANAPAR